MTVAEYRLIEINKLLFKLSKSSFRSRFHLSEKDRQYVLEKGYDIISQHAYDFIDKRLSPKVILNDGKQTPMGGHPVFIAQHATATCCRSCLYKCHHIAKGKELTKEQIDYIVFVIMKWIKKEVNAYDVRR